MNGSAVLQEASKEGLGPRVCGLGFGNPGHCHFYNYSHQYLAPKPEAVQGLGFRLQGPI